MVILSFARRPRVSLALTVSFRDRQYGRVFKRFYGKGNPITQLLNP